MHRSLVYRALGLAGGLAIASCVQDSTSPHGTRAGQLAIAPVFETRALLLVDFERVRIRLVRPGTNEVVLDTTVLFPAGADSLALSVTVPVQGSGEVFSLALAMMNAAGDTVFRGGPTDIQVQPGILNTAPAQTPMRYTGVGAGAASVRFVARPSVTFFGDTTLFTAEALDSAGAVIPNTPIVFSVSDTAMARVPNPAVGRVVAKTVRGTVEVRANLLTPPMARAALSVEPRPTTLAIVSGNNQTGTVGAALSQPLTALVGAAGGSGVRGVQVNFAVATGGGSLSAASAVTDSLGRASVTWTLGTIAGAQTATAAAAGLTPAAVTYSATAAAGAARTLLYTLAPPTSVAATSTFNVTVAARDTFGNVATGFTGPVTLALGANPGAATLLGITNLSAVAGVAAFTVRVGVAASGYTIVASSAGLSSVTSAPISVSAGTPARLVFATPPSNVVAGAAIVPAVVVAIQDAVGNLVPTATDSVTVSLTNGVGGATLGGTRTVAAVAGRATFANLTVDRAGAGYQLVPSAASIVARDTSVVFTVSPAAAAAVVFVTGPGSATAGALFAPAVQVAVLDAFGNVVTTYGDTVTVTLATNPTGDSLSGARKVVATAGVAAFTDLALHRAASGYQLRATANGVSASATGAAFAVAPAAAARLVFAVPPSNVTVGFAITPAVVVRAEDAFGNLVPTFAGTVGLAFGANPGGATLTGTTSVAASGGVATFSGLTLDRTGAGYTLVASSGVLSAATSAPFTAQASVPSQLAFVVLPSNAAAGAAIAPAVQVALRDALNNLVTGATDSVTIALGANPGGGTLGGTRTVAAVAGVATFANLSLDRSGAGYTLIATSGVLTAATSNAFDVAPSAAAALARVSGDAQSGTLNTALAAPLVVSVRDAFGNLVPGFPVTWTATSGGGTLPATSLTDASGLAQASWTLGALLGPQTAAAAATGLTGSPVAFAATASPLGTTMSWTGSASTDWNTGGNWTGGAAPTPTDIVFVPTAASRQPRISASAMVGGLIVQNGATLTIDTLQTLAVGGSADASYASVGGPGWVFLAGTGTVRGHFRALTVQGQYAIRDSLLVTDTLLIIGAPANLSGGGGYARIGRDLVVSQGTLTMAAGDSIDVLGSATFAGGSENGRLTGGVLRVAGNFSQLAAYSPESFLATTNHRLVLNGTVPQTVTLMSSGAGGSALGNLVVANTSGAGLGLASNVQVNGALTVPTAATITQAAPYGLTVNGNLTTSGTLNLDALHVAGVLNATAALRLYNVQRTVFTGTAQTIPDTLAFRYLAVGPAGTAAFTAGMARTLDTLVAQGRLDMNGAKITTSLFETSTATGVLVMDAAADSLAVNGYAGFLGGPSVLSAGTLHVTGGAFVENGTGTTQAYAAAAAHTTLIGGSTTVSFTNPDTTASHVGRLAVAFSGNATLLTNAVAAGPVDLAAYAGLGGERLLAMDSIAVGMNGTLNPLALDVVRGFGVLNGNVAPVDTLYLRGSDGIPDTVTSRWSIPNLVVAGSDSVVVPGTGAAVGGSLFLQGGTFLVDGTTTVLDSLVVTGTGVVAIRNGDPSLRVTGNARFAGAPTAGRLSAGAFYFAGNFRQEGDPQSFRPTGTNVFTNGALPQVFSFASPGATASGFRDFYAGSQVRFASDVHVGGTMVVYAPSIVNDTLGSWTATLATGLTDYNTGVAGWRVDNTILTAAATAWPTFTTTNLFVRNSLTAAGYTVTGNVTVESGGLLDPGIGIVTVNGSLATTGTGVLRQSAGTLTVGGNASFAGGSTVGLLTGGTLTLNGNFVQTGVSGSQFAGTGNHRVAFTRSSGVQTIQFQDPAGSYFRDLTLNRAALDTVRLLSNVQVNDTAVVTGRTVLASTAFEALRLTSTGVLRLPNSLAVIRPSRVEFGSIYADSAGDGAARVMPDTAVFLNGGSIPTGVAYDLRSIRVAGGTLTSMTPHIIRGNMVISGGAYRVDTYATDSIAGYLRTEGTGKLSMVNSMFSGPPMLAVQDSAVFAGGLTDSLLVGTLRIYGSFVQRSTVVGSSFQAGTNHVTQFSGLPSANQSITFATPGITATDSRFGVLLLARAVAGVAQPVSLRLGSAFYATMFSDTSAGAIDTLKSTAGEVITVGGFNLNSTVLDSTKIVVATGTGPVSGNTVTFRRMPRSWFQMEISRPAGTPISLSTVNFMPLITGDLGTYFGAYQTSVGALPFTLTFTGSTPASVTGRYSKLGSAVVSWNGATLP